MVTQKVNAWDVLQEHPIAKELDSDTKLALTCEYIDLQDELQGMSLADFINVYFAPGEAEGAAAPVAAPAPPPAETKPKRTRNKVKVEPKVEEPAVEPIDNGDGAEGEEDDESSSVVRPESMVGMRVVYRFPGRNVLSDENGVTSDTGGVVTFTDVEGAPWSKVSRDRVYPIDPENYFELHIIPREAREVEIWLAGTPQAGQPEGALLRSMALEFDKIPEKITFAIMNGKRPYVDRFVALPNNGFEDDQKPTTRFFGEHCFRVRQRDYIVNVVSP